jgi:hypothetical protein
MLKQICRGGFLFHDSHESENERNRECERERARETRETGENACKLSLDKRTHAPPHAHSQTHACTFGTLVHPHVQYTHSGQRSVGVRPPALFRRSFQRPSPLIFCPALPHRSHIRAALVCWAHTGHDWPTTRETMPVIYQRGALCFTNTETTRVTSTISNAMTQGQTQPITGPVPLAQLVQNNTRAPFLWDCTRKKARKEGLASGYQHPPTYTHTRTHTQTSHGRDGPRKVERGFNFRSRFVVVCSYQLLVVTYRRMVLFRSHLDKYTFGSHDTTFYGFFA